MKGATFMDENNIGLKIQPLAGDKEVDAKIDRRHANEWPVQFFTSTTNMKDWIGNVTEIADGKCSAKGVYRGEWVEINNIRICSDEIKQVGNRVMVTEHMDVNGKMGLIATTKRVLVTNQGSAVNYACVGWSNDKRCRYLRFDVYTGEHKIFEQDPVYSIHKGKVG